MKNKNKKRNHVLWTISCIICVAIFYSIYIFNTGLSYKEIVPIYITLISGVIGGVGTLLSVYFANKQTKEIQKHDSIERDIKEIKNLCIELNSINAESNKLRTTVYRFLKKVQSDKNIVNPIASEGFYEVSINLNMFSEKLFNIKAQLYSCSQDVNSEYINDAIDKLLICTRDITDSLFCKDEESLYDTVMRIDEISAILTIYSNNDLVEIIDKYKKMIM